MPSFPATGSFPPPGVGKPFAVERPVIGSVRILFDRDDGRRAVLTVIDDDGRALGELDRVADDGPVLGERLDGGYVIPLFEGGDDTLHGGEVRVHAVAELFEFLKALLELVHALDEFGVVIRVAASGCQHAETRKE